MNLEHLSGTAIVILGIVGSWGLYKQAQAIWVNKSAKSVSGEWLITFAFTFVSLIIYGLRQDSLPMELQGSIRFLFMLPSVVGFFVYGAAHMKHWILIALYTLLLVWMGYAPAFALFYIFFAVLGICSTLLQAHTIHKKTFRGNVSIELQLVSILAAFFWSIYGFVREDKPVFFVAIGFFIAHFLVIMMWKKHPVEKT